MVRPDTRDLVNKRLSGMAVGGGELDREIGGNENIGQNPKCVNEEQSLSDRGPVCKHHQAGLSAVTAKQRDDPLR